jgi:hypothetical protein
MSASPIPLWGQWTGTNPVWTDSSVGIGATPAAGTKLDVRGLLHANLATNGSQSVVVNGGIVLGAPGTSTGAYFMYGNDGLIANALRGVVFSHDDYGPYHFTFGKHPANQPLRGDGVGFVPQMTLTNLGNLGIGTTNPQYKLAVEGAIGARDIIVTNAPWSDYVFRPDYQLRPLSEVNAFIQAHRHLPDMPSEAEVKEQGVSVSEMQAKLLAKIEELTLHLIRQEKENGELRERLVKLESRAAER